MNHNLVSYKYGFVEDVKYARDYKNIDYWDTIIPLWEELYKMNMEHPCKQTHINLALCASIIQMSGSHKYNRDLYQQYISREINRLNLEIDELALQIKKNVNLT
jgi:hypothetical protein